MAKITDFEQDIIDMIEQKATKLLRKKSRILILMTWPCFWITFMTETFCYCLGFYQRTWRQIHSSRWIRIGREPLSIASR